MNYSKQIKAVSYAIYFLENEITSIKESINGVVNLREKNLLERRLNELEKDYEMFTDYLLEQE